MVSRRTAQRLSPLIQTFITKFCRKSRRSRVENRARTFSGSISRGHSSVWTRKEPTSLNRSASCPMYAFRDVREVFATLTLYVRLQGISTLVETYGNLDNVSIITLAPEKPNALDVIAELTKRNVTASLGHSMANFTEGEEAVRRGSNLITHLFNAMLPVIFRDNYLRFVVII